MPRPVNHRKFNKKEIRKTAYLTEKELADGVRLNKYIAHCGICSRRKAADYVAQGLVLVNDVVATEVGLRIMPNDVVKYAGKVIEPEKELVYLLMNKPINTITSVSDDRGRKTVMDLINKEDVKVRIFPVGRLDWATTGLLMLTNDGDLAKKLTHPSHEVPKIYHVFLDEPISSEDLQKIRDGLTLEDGPVPVDGVNYVKGKSKNEVGIELHIGRNRIVRRIFAHLGYEVVKLDRVYYAGLTKQDIPRGRYRFLTQKEVIMLKHFI